MREILFRGQTRRKGEKVWMDGSPMESNWVYGGVCQGIGDFSIIYGNVDEELKKPTEKWVVYTDTLGQFTGLTDKNGRKIFEGDIIRADNGKQSSVAIVKYGDYLPELFYKMLDMYICGKQHLLAHGFYAVSIGKGEEMILLQSPCTEIIGNIHDNPELLGGDG